MNFAAAMCELSDEIFDYQYVCQGKVDADTVDDGEDMKYLHVRETLLSALNDIVHIHIILYYVICALI